MTLRDAGRPFPSFSDDEVLDFLITEAIRDNVRKEADKQQEKQKRADWRGDHRSMRAGGAGRIG